MKIDVNANLGHWALRKLRYGQIDAFRSLLDREAIDRALVAPIDSILNEDFLPGNEDLLAQLEAARDERLVPCFVVNPRFPKWQDRIEPLLARARVRTIKLYPSYHDYTVLDPVFDAALEWAAEKQLKVIVQMRVVDVRHHPENMVVPDVTVDALATRLSKPLPTLLIVGGIKAHEVSILAEKLRENENSVIEISHVDSMRGIQRTVEQIGAEKVLFGTHVPFFYARAASLKVDYAELPDEVKQQIYSANAERLLGPF